MTIKTQASDPNAPSVLDEEVLKLQSALADAITRAASEAARANASEFEHGWRDWEEKERQSRSLAEAPPMQHPAKVSTLIPVKVPASMWGGHDL